MTKWKLCICDKGGEHPIFFSFEKINALETNFVNCYLNIIQKKMFVLIMPAEFGIFMDFIFSLSVT